MGTSPLKTTTLSSALKPLSVRGKDAQLMLSIGETLFEDLVKRGEFEVFYEGTARRFTVASLEAYVDRKVAAGERPARPRGPARARS